MMLEFDSDDEIVTDGRAPAPAPAPAAPTDGLALEFDSDDEIVAPPPPPREEEKAAAADAAAGWKRPREEEPEELRLPPRKRSMLKGDDFFPCPTFQESREGYVFKRGAQGLGYYFDPAQKKRKKTANKVAAVKWESDKESTVDALKTVTRVCTLLGSCGEDKVAKILAMLAKLCEAPGCVGPATSALIVGALRRFAASGVVGAAVAEPLSLVVDGLVRQPKEAFSAADRSDVVTWSLALSTARQLRTDDTYIYAKALKRVTEAIAALRNDESDAAVSRRDAIIHCLRSALQAYETTLWAKQPLETAVLQAAEKRQLFTEKQRDRLDRMTTAVREKQRGKTVAVSAVRQKDAVYHPLHNY